jgi:hypothetical protein
VERDFCVLRLFVCFVMTVSKPSASCTLSTRATIELHTQPLLLSAFKVPLLSIKLQKADGWMERNGLKSISY